MAEAGSTRLPEQQAACQQGRIRLTLELALLEVFMVDVWQILNVKPYAATFPLMEKITGCVLDLPGPRKGRALLTFPPDKPAAWTPVTSNKYRLPRTTKYVERLQLMLGGIIFVDPEIANDLVMSALRGETILGGKYVKVEHFMVNGRVCLVAEKELADMRMIEKASWAKRAETDKHRLPKLKPGDKVAIKSSVLGLHGTVNRVSGDQIKVTLANGVLQSAVVSRLMLDLLPDSSDSSTSSAVVR